MTASMWQVARQQSVKHYGMLEDFVSMVTEAVPQLLTDRQRRLLLLALRAKVTLSDPQVTLSDPQVTLTHRSEDTMDDETSSLQSLLTQSPDDRQRLLQEVFDHSFDSALQELISDFLSRTEQLFPVPDFKQTACWLSAAPGGFEECLQEAEHLRELLTNQSCRLGKASTTVRQDTENVLLTAWSHPLLNKPANQEPPPANSQSEALPDVQSDPPTDVQSDPPPDVQSEPLSQVKVEVLVLKEGQEETVIGQSEEQEASNQSAAGGGDSWDITPVIVEVHRLKESPGDSADQSEDTGDQSDQSPEAPPPRVYRASPAQRVAHKCPRCGKCFIYRSQVIRHLSTSKSCSSALRRASSTQAPPPDTEPRPLPSGPRPPPLSLLLPVQRLLQVAGGAAQPPAQPSQPHAVQLQLL
ncbi:uncharacterized protein LOC117469107 isoform X2 [Trematomus bernacchii]|uniref:uncharacterized protein LOC117469107 isoform X2 n=1 Tax=Trematomus bernacchii TaxID=40690 RepID=UPI00146F7309|nr:uncharacterized protein LOC117469107 isoform X2 [Trematomus bernacchii]